MAEINGYVPTSDHQQGLMEGMLTIVFDVHINKKVRAFNIQQRLAAA